MAIISRIRTLLTRRGGPSRIGAARVNAKGGAFEPVVKSTKLALYPGDLSATATLGNPVTSDPWKGDVQWMSTFDDGTIKDVATGLTLTKGGSGAAGIALVAGGRTGDNYALRVVNSSSVSGTIPYNITATDWCVETWMYSEGAPGASSMYLYAADGSGAGFRFYPNLGGVTSLLVYTTGPTVALTLNAGSILIPNAAWTHVAITRDGGTFCLYINGVKQLEGVAATTSASTTWTQMIGQSTSLFNNVLHDNFRVTIGTCRYRGNFTPEINYGGWTSPGVALTKVGGVPAGTNLYFQPSAAPAYGGASPTWQVHTTSVGTLPNQYAKVVDASLNSLTAGWGKSTATGNFVRGLWKTDANGNTTYLNGQATTAAAAVGGGGTAIDLDTSTGKIWTVSNDRQTSEQTNLVVYNSDGTFSNAHKFAANLHSIGDIKTFNNGTGAYVAGSDSLASISYITLVKTTGSAVTWSKKFGDGITSYTDPALAVDSSQNAYVLLRYSSTTATILKVNSAGTTVNEWSAIVGNADSTSGSNHWSIRVDSSGNIFMCIPLGASGITGQGGFAFIKLDSAFNTVFHKEVGTATMLAASASYIDATGNLWVTGADSAVTNRSYYMKLDNTGAIVWQFKSDGSYWLNVSTNAAATACWGNGTYVDFGWANGGMRFTDDGAFPSGTWTDPETSGTMTFSSSTYSVTTQSVTWSSGTTNTMTAAGYTSSALGANNVAGSDVATNSYVVTQSPAPGWPTTYQSSAPTLAGSNVLALPAANNYALTAATGTTQTAIPFTANADSLLQSVYFGRYISPQLASNVTLSGDIEIFVADNISASVDFTAGAPDIYVWRPSTGAVVGRIEASNIASRVGSFHLTTEAVSSAQVTPDAEVAALAGDVIVIELWGWINTNNGAANTGNAFIGGAETTTTNGATVTNYASGVQFQQTLSFVGGSTSVTLAAVASAVASATSALTDEIPLAAAPAGVATTTANLTNGIPLAAAATGTATATAAVTTVLNVAASATSTSTATAALSLSVPLAAAPAAVSTAVAAVNQSVVLVAAAVSVSTVSTASLATTLQLAAAATAASTSTADLFIPFVVADDSTFNGGAFNTTTINGAGALSSGSAQSLAATPAATATATAGLTLAVPLAAAPVGLATTTAAVGLTVPLAATPAGVATVTGAVALAVPLAAAPAGQATAIAAINQTVQMVAAAVSVGTVGTAALTIAKPLAAAAVGVATVTADLTSGANLAAAPAAVATATAQLTNTIPLAASAADVSTTTSALTLSIPLAAAPVATATVTAAAGVTVPLAAAAQAVSTAVAAVNQTVQMLAAPVAVATVGTASLSLATPLASAPAAVATVTAALTTVGVGAVLSADSAATASATAALGLAVPLAASNSATATATPSLGVTVNLAAAPAAVSVATGAINQTVQMLAAPVAVSTVGTAQLSVTKPLASAAQSVATVNATLSGTSFIQLAAAPADVATVTADVTVTRLLASATAAVSTATAELFIQEALDTAAAASASATAALAIGKAMASSAQAVATLDSTLTVYAAYNPDTRRTFIVSAENRGIIVPAEVRSSSFVGGTRLSVAADTRALTFTV